MNVAGLGVDELAGLVCTTLEQYGIDVVLTGGSCVSVWTHNAYASLDLDFIALGLHSNHQIGEALRDIGFTARTSNGRYFQHPETELVLEFPPGPLMVGDEQVREERIDKRASDAGVVRLLSPTDCIKDRLAGFYHWKDEQNFDQALSLALTLIPLQSGLPGTISTENRAPRAMLSALTPRRALPGSVTSVHLLNQPGRNFLRAARCPENSSGLR